MSKLSKLPAAFGRVVSSSAFKSAGKRFLALGSIVLSAALLSAATPSGPIPADAHLKGMWSPVANWPLIAIHAVLLPGGRVLTYGTDGAGKQTGYFIYDVWDPSAGPEAGHLTLPNGTGTDIFCGSQVVLPQSGAGVLLAGGDNWDGTKATNTGTNDTTIFDYNTNTLTRSNDMHRPRWYSTATTLTNGEVYIQGGKGGTDLPEVRSTDGSFRLLSNANTSALHYSYPRNFVAPDGRVFGFDSGGVMYYVDTNELGSLTTVGQFAAAYRGSDASAAMFRPGRILQFGGASNGAIVIDITGGAPVVTPTQSMSSHRRLATATLLPNGKVLATGGSAVWNQLTGVAYAAEIWDPDTGTWTVGALGALPRLYHSTALLLPDATVLVGGGGAPGPYTNLNVEIYYPPYLFTAEGTLAVRPSIVAAPDLLEIGATFAVDVADAAAISRVTLVKTGSVTHDWNMEQRFIELGFSASGTRLDVQAPTGAADAPPGTYLLFVIDAAGVPSEARMVRIEPNGTTPNEAPTVNAGADQAITLPGTASLTGTATDDGQPNPPAALTQSWSKVSGPGTVSFSAPGALSTTASFSTSGLYVVRLTVSDGAKAASDDVAITVNPAPNQAPTVNAGADQAITLPGTASLTGAATDDGQPNPPGALTRNWSKVSGPGTVTFSAPSALSTTASFSASGAYVLRLTVSDGALAVSDDVAITVNPAPTGNGLTGRYYNDPGTGAKFTNLVLTRVDPIVSFDWGYTSPSPLVTNDNFSVRWTGYVQAPVTGNYQFSTLSDDGVRVWVNGKLVVNNWTDHIATINYGTYIALSAGAKYPVVMEYYEHTNAAKVRLRWAYPGALGATVIPQSRLFP